MHTKKELSLSFLFLLVFLIQSTQCQTKTYKIRTISFYNVENLFDTIDNPNTFDEDFTRKGKNHYTSKIYWNKIENISKVIAQIGFEKTNTSPAVIGLAEIENITVLKDLINSKNLKNKQYKIIHYDSPDRRGIDVALLYQEKYFTPLHHENYEVRLWDELGNRIYTRDQLLVSGLLGNDLIHIIVNHWPSRRGGKTKSNAKRIKSAFVTQQIMEFIRKENENAKIIIMGDFNDDPSDISIKKKLITTSNSETMNHEMLYNPMENMYKKGLNTLGYRDGINLFDQILLSYDLISHDKEFKSYKFYRAGIFNPQYLINQQGPYKGYPFRSFEYSNYTGGYSDHFPVYLYLIKNE